MKPVIKTYWVMMDKKRKVIGMGVPRDRRLQFLDSYDGSGRLLTYKTKGRASAGYRGSGFWTSSDVKTYVIENYPENTETNDMGYKWIANWEFLEAVEIEIIIKEKNND